MGNGGGVMAEDTPSDERRAGGQRMRWSGKSACGLRDGRIVRWREYYLDPVGLARAASG